MPIRPLDQALSFLEGQAAQILPKGYVIDYTGESRQLRREGGDAIAERVHGLPMGDEVVGIGLAVATDVGQAVGLRRIGPPVVAVGMEVVRGALGVRCAVSRDRDGRQGEGGIGRPQDPLAVEAGHVDRHRR